MTQQEDQTNRTPQSIHVQGRPSQHRPSSAAVPPIPQSPMRLTATAVLPMPRVRQSHPQNSQLLSLFMSCSSETSSRIATRQASHNHRRVVGAMHSDSQAIHADILSPSTRRTPLHHHRPSPSTGTTPARAAPLGEGGYRFRIRASRNRSLSRTYPRYSISCAANEKRGTHILLVPHPIHRHLHKRNAG